MKKGTTNNKNGAPYSWETFRAKLKKYANSITELKEIDISKVHWKDAIAIKQILRAYEDDNQVAVNWVSERSDGKVKEVVETTNKTELKMDLTEYKKIRKKVIKGDDV